MILLVQRRKDGAINESPTTADLDKDLAFNGDEAALIKELLLGGNGDRDTNDAADDNRRTMD